jgi:hypothetical protein
LKIIREDLSGDATTIKNKQSDQEILSVQNHQLPSSPQHTNTELSPAGNVQEQVLFAAENEAAPPLSSASHGSPESSTNFNL